MKRGIDMGIAATIELDWGNPDQDEFSVTVQSGNGTEGNGCPEHWHDCFEILYCTAGESGVVIEGKRFLLHRGELAVIPPRVTHYTNHPGAKPFEVIVFGYGESVICTADNSLLNLRYLTLFRSNVAASGWILNDSDRTRRMGALIEEGREIFASDSPTRPLEMRACILHLHALLYTGFLSTGAHSPKEQLRYLTEAQTFIVEHLSAPISPADVASHLYISQSYLCRLTRRSFGLTVNQLIMQFRLNEAKRLLIERPDLNVTEIGGLVGIPETSYFIRQFRRSEGLTPLAYRRAEQKSVPSGKTGKTN